MYELPSWLTLVAIAVILLAVSTWAILIHLRKLRSPVELIWGIREQRRMADRRRSFGRKAD